MPETIHLWGEALCLDYANTVDWLPDDEHLHPEQSDVLRTPDMLGRWGQRLDLLSDATFASADELCHARVLRDAVYCLFSSISRGEEPSKKDLEVLMSNYTQAVKHASLLASQNVYKLDWLAHDPRRIRYAVATDAVALLADPRRLARVSRCPGRGCGWLFLNTSGRRRWCSMTTCGSREKMRRLHQRRTQHTD
ncbi:MAG TPA: ABATE domain-containing protein [Solirubrobacteraceae bacterium]|jgi:predicted RNA-binding Zn ribbon-like protein|nr:ABATE domain-containing protein [Solirubrobacteraceae bacterium]